MTQEQIEKAFENKCKHCQKLLRGSWCIEFGVRGCNPHNAIIQCNKKDFEPFKKKVED